MLRGFGRRLFGRRGFGYIEDPDDDRDRDIDRLGLGAASIESFSLREFSGPPLDQGPTNTCVPHAVLGGEVTFHAARGSAVPLGSINANYYLSRVQHGAERWDAGTYIRLDIKALAKWGIVEARFWPFDPWKINTQPPISVLVPSSKRRGIRGYYRIFDADPLPAIRAAIYSKRPVVFGMSVTDDFVADVGPDHIEYPAKGRVLGLHAMQCVAFKPGYLGIKNSYGRKYRDGGFVWISEEYARSSWRDIWVVDPGAP